MTDVISKRSWRITRSAWIAAGALSFGALTWAGFLYVGRKMGNPKLVRYAAFYGAGLVLAIGLIGVIAPVDDEGVPIGPLAWIGFFIWVGVWIGGLIHSLKINRSWLLHAATAAPWWETETATPDSRAAPPAHPEMKRESSSSAPDAIPPAVSGAKAVKMGATTPPPEPIAGPFASASTQPNPIQGGSAPAAPTKGVFEAEAAQSSHNTGPKPWWQSKWVLGVGAFLALFVIAIVVSPAEDEAVDGAAVEPIIQPVATTPPEDVLSPTAIPAAPVVPTALPIPEPPPTVAPLPTATQVSVPPPTDVPIELSQETEDVIAALSIRLVIDQTDPLLALSIEALSDDELVDFADDVCVISLSANSSDDLAALLLVANRGAMDSEQVAALAGASMGARCPDELARLGLD